MKIILRGNFLYTQSGEKSIKAKSYYITASEEILSIGWACFILELSVRFLSQGFWDIHGGMHLPSLLLWWQKISNLICMIGYLDHSPVSVHVLANKKKNRKAFLSKTNFSTAFYYDQHKHMLNHSFQWAWHYPNAFWPEMKITSQGDFRNLEGTLLAVLM